VGGQLQHPGIVPIYGIGLEDDGRPRFAMKLIKGQTLAELLDSNPKKIDLLAVFEHVAQTMAYAHSRGVIHRDLKPANVMVGAFGEVQIVDWGFAKVLGQEEVAPQPEHTVIATVRSSGEGSQSIAGSVMGTPAYMPPEQAMGRIEDLDERSDVFALGAILCEILTGEAPYTGNQKDQLIAAAQCRLEKAHERLEAAEAADGLKQLALDCLQPLSGDRPNSARVVADRLSEHLANVETRARQSELEALTSETSAARAHQGRMRALVLACVGLFAVLAGGGGYFAWKSDRDAREARAAPLIASAMREATAREGEGDWSAAVAAAQEAVDIAATDGVEDAGARALLVRLENARAAAEEAVRIRGEDDAFLAELEEIRGRWGQVVVAAGAPGPADPAGSTVGGSPFLVQDAKSTDAAYTAAFTQHFGSIDASAERLAASRHAEALAANLTFWAWIRKVKLRAPEWTAVDRLAREIDPRHQDVRDALYAGDVGRLDALVGKRGADLPLALAGIVGLVLAENGSGGTQAALDFLQAWHRRAPGDFWINLSISIAAPRLGRNDLAARHATAAIAVRPAQPSGWLNLSNALVGKGDGAGAVASCRRAIEAGLGSGLVYINLGCALRLMGDRTASIAACRRAVELEPAVALAHANLAASLLPSGQVSRGGADGKEVFLLPSAEEVQAGDVDEAIAACRRAIELNPRLAYAYGVLGSALSAQGHGAAAIAAYRREIQLSRSDGKLMNAHYNLGNMLLEKGDVDGALAAYRRSIRHDPRYAMVHNGLGGALSKKGRPAEARASFRRAVELDPEVAIYHSNLGLALQRAGEIQDALAAYRRAIELDPKFAQPRTGVGDVLLMRGDLRGAIAAFRLAIRLDSKLAATHYNLGTALLRSGELKAAIVALRRAIGLDAQMAAAHFHLGNALAMSDDRDGAISALRQALELVPGPAPAIRSALAMLEREKRLEPTLARMLAGEAVKVTPLERATLGRMLCMQKQRYVLALKMYAQAFDQDPALAADLGPQRRYNAACCAARTGKTGHSRALAWLRADLEAWAKRLGSNPAWVLQMLAHWKRDPDLASVRDGDDLSDDFKKLWADVDALLERAKEASK